MSTLGIALIVKNESKVIERCLTSVLPIADFITVCDTGSTDNTCELIESFCFKNKIDFIILKSEWKNFSANRNELLVAAKGKTDYTLLMDADEVVVIPPTFNKNNLFADAFYIHYDKETFDYAQILLIKNDLSWMYRGVTHEYISSVDAKTYDTSELKMIHLHDGKNRENKFQRDIELLLKGIVAEPNNSRYHFYLGQSFCDLGENQKAIDYYNKAISLSRWVEEGFYARYKIGICLERLGKFQDASKAYMSAWEFRPTRFEPLYRLAVLHRNLREFNLAYLFASKGLELSYPKDMLFIERDIFAYGMLFERSISSYYVGNYQESYDDNKKLLELNIPDNIRQQVKSNIIFSEIKLFGEVKSSVMNQDDCLQNLEEIIAAGEKRNINIFPCAGTLLGIIREDRFLLHDTDMDLAIKANEWNPEIIDDLIYLGFTLEGKWKNGFKLTELRFRKCGIQIDIFIFHEKNKDTEVIYCYDNNGGIYELAFYKFDLGVRDFNGLKVTVPVEAEEFLRQQYGDDWKIPKQEWSYIKDAFNIRKIQ